MKRTMKKGKLVEENAGFDEKEAKAHIEEMEKLTQAIVDVFDPKQPFYRRILGLKESPKKVNPNLAIACISIAGVAIAKKAGMRKHEFIAACQGAWESTQHRWQKDDS